jgi:hypothetical protein
MTKNEDVSWISQKTRKASIRGFTTEELIAELKSRHELCPVVNEMTEPVCMCVSTTESLVKELIKRDEVTFVDIPLDNTAYTRVWKNLPESEYGCSGIDIHTARFINGPARILVVVD